jgi:hypothetical protein
MRDSIGGISRRLQYVNGHSPFMASSGKERPIPSGSVDGERAVLHQPDAVRVDVRDGVGAPFMGADVSIHKGGVS